MFEIMEIQGCGGGETYLIMTPDRAVLWDTGYAFCAEITVGKIRQALGQRSLDYILLSHSHYDHLDGCAKIKAAFPQAIVAAHQRVTRILEKESAKALMRAMDDKRAKQAGLEPDSAAVEHLSIDRSLTDNTRLPWGDNTIVAMEMPGHTRCSMSFYFEEEGLLAASESVGVTVDYPQAIPSFIVGYQMTLDSISRAQGLHLQHLMLAHYGLLPAEGIETFLANSKDACIKLKEFILALHDQGYSQQEILDQYEHVYYKETYTKVLPRAAHLLNRQQMIPRLLAEMGRQVEA